MEALRRDDPRRFGRYTVLARDAETAGAVRFVARGATPDDLAVVTSARPALAQLPAFRRRFEAEARTAERLAGRWVEAPLDLAADAPDDAAGPDGGAADAGAPGLWTATRFVPALTLAEAIALAGPLPKRAVRILGAGLAEVLSRVHAAGSPLQGLAPGTVELAVDGPRLTAFGPLGAAAFAEAKPGGQLSVRLGYLTPEQVAGQEVGPASDLFVLGLLLAYAATGTTPLADGPPDRAAERIAHGEAALDSVPQEVRALIASCLAKAPADRPTAGAVAAELALEGAAALAKEGWLPERLVAAVADRDARVRALEAPQEAREPQEADEPASSAAATTAARTPEDAVPGTAGTRDPVPAEAGPSDAVPPAPQGADAASTALALRGPGAPVPAGDTGAGTSPGAALAPARHAGPPAGEERADTTRFLNTRARHAQNDRPTTQLAVPQELRSAAPAAAPAPGANAPGAAGPGTGGPSYPAPYSGTALPTGSAPLPTALSQPAPPPAPAPQTGLFPNRRAVLTTAAAAAAGLLIGAGTVAALGSDETAASTDDKPAATPTSILPGRPPEPSWAYAHPASEAVPTSVALWKDRLLVLTSEVQATGVDLRTGARIWQRADAAGGQRTLVADDSLCFVASPTEFLWLSAADGEVKHRVRYADQFSGLPGLRVGGITGQSGSVIWFTGSVTVTVKAPEPKKGQKPGKDQQVPRAFFFAYDLVRRAELWRVPVGAGRGGTPEYRLVGERLNDIVVRQAAWNLTAADEKAAKGKSVFHCFDRKTGKRLWSKPFGNVAPGAAAYGDEEGRLFASVADDLEAFDTESGKPLWRVDGTADSGFGTPVGAGDLIHTANRNQEIGAVARDSGKVLWRSSTEVPIGDGAPALTVTASGKTVLASDATQVTAFAGADGRRLWKFQDLGARSTGGAEPAARTGAYRVLTAGEILVVVRDRAVYAFPVR